MKAIQITLAILLILPSVLSIKPEASMIGDVLYMPASNDGLEYTLPPESWEYYEDTQGRIFYVWEYDPEITVMARYVNNRTMGIEFQTAIDQQIPLEICFGPDADLDIPGLKNKDWHDPINCYGTKALSFIVNTNREYTFMFKNELQSYTWYAGSGAGGGGIGCSLACSPCYANSISHGSTPSSVNTETNFNHQATIVMTVCSGCTCPISYRHNSVSSVYYEYTSSYPAYFTKTVAKLISGSNPRVVSSTGTYANTIQCGGQNGNLYLRLETSGIRGAIYSYKTVSCTDAQPPLIEQQTPANLSIINSSWINFTCNASDNTGLKYIDLFTNLTGSWALNQSQSYGLLVYSATKTFSVTGIETGVNHGWECRARDTRSPTNDAYTGKRYWTTTLIEKITEIFTPPKLTPMPPLAVPKRPSLAFYIMGVIGGILIIFLIRTKKRGGE